MFWLDVKRCSSRDAPSCFWWCCAAKAKSANKPRNSSRDTARRAMGMLRLNNSVTQISKTSVIFIRLYEQKQQRSRSGRRLAALARLGMRDSDPDQLHRNGLAVVSTERKARPTEPGDRKYYSVSRNAGHLRLIAAHKSVHFCTQAPPIGGLRLPAGMIDLRRPRGARLVGDARADRDAGAATGQNAKKSSLTGPAAVRDTTEDTPAAHP
ncbi:hypothetical protein ACVWXM_006315 [Bradyrhizobium sp. GM7.3]